MGGRWRDGTNTDKTGHDTQTGLLCKTGKKQNQGQAMRETQRQQGELNEKSQKEISQTSVGSLETSFPSQPRAIDPFSTVVNFCCLIDHCSSPMMQTGTLQCTFTLFF